MHRLESEETQMIKIERPEDLRIFRDKPNIHPLIVRYLTDYLYFFLREYRCPDMTEFGAFFLLENREDSLHHTNMGLSLPLKQSACFAEFTEVLTLRSPIQEVRLLHSCFVLNDSYAISVFMEPGILEPETEHILLEDFTFKEVRFDVSK